VILHSPRTKAAHTDIGDIAQEISQRREAEKDCEALVAESIGSAQLEKKLRDLRHRRIRIQLTFVENELTRRRADEGQLRAAVRETGSSDELRERMKALKSARIDFEETKQELARRQKLENEMETAVADTVGSGALLAFCERVREGPSFSRVVAELEHRLAAEEKLKDAMAITTSSEALIDKIQTIKSEHHRISFEEAELEVKKRHDQESSVVKEGIEAELARIDARIQRTGHKKGERGELKNRKKELLHQLGRH